MVISDATKDSRFDNNPLNLESNSLLWTSITREIHGVDIDYAPEIDNAINFYKKGFSRNQITKAIKEGKPWDLELEIITKEGKEIWVQSIGKSNYINGVSTKVYGTFQSIEKDETTSSN